MKMPFGLKDGELIHISKADPGLKCGCVCPGCNGPLVARKGEVKVHHFAHYSSECKNGLQTAIHMAAKVILQKYGKIKLPAVDIQFEQTYNTWRLSEEMEICFDEVRLEKRLGDVVPDVLVYKNGVPLMIEIKVTHEVDEEKRGKIQSLGVSALEIDLGDVDQDTPMDDLVQFVIYSVERKKWIYNEKANNAKHAILRSNVVKTLQRGTLGNNLLNGCPQSNFWWKGYRTARWTDCLNCKYCLCIGDKEVFCSAESRVGSYNEFILHTRLFNGEKKISN